MQSEDIKKDRNREAHERIGRAIKNEYYFEAITILESIIRDRIFSFLLSTGCLSEGELNRLSFAQLITLWKVATKNPGCIWTECESLISNIDAWRIERNKYVHGLVKLPSKKAVVTTTDFLTGAKKAAEKGQLLVDEIKAWRKQQTAIKSAYTRKN